MDVLAMATSLTRRIEAVDEIDQLALFPSDMLQGFEKCPESQVANLATPHPLHPTQVQGFEEQDIVAIGQGMGQFEEPVLPPVSHSQVDLSQMAFGLGAVVRAFLLAGQLAIGLSDLAQRLLEKLGRLYRVGLHPIVDGQEGLQTEIKPRHLTGRRFEFWQRHFLGHAQIEVAHCVSLECDSFDRPREWTIGHKLIGLLTNLDPVAAQKLVACLFQGETLVLAGLLKARRSDFEADFAAHRPEEELVSFLDALSDVLQRLRGDVIQPGVLGQPLEFGQVLHQGILVQVFAK